MEGCCTASRRPARGYHRKQPPSCSRRAVASDRCLGIGRSCSVSQMALKWCLPNVKLGGTMAILAPHFSIYWRLREFPFAENLTGARCTRSDICVPSHPTLHSQEPSKILHDAGMRCCESAAALPRIPLHEYARPANIPCSPALLVDHAAQRVPCVASALA